MHSTISPSPDMGSDDHIHLSQIDRRVLLLSFILCALILLPALYEFDHSGVGRTSDRIVYGNESSKKEGQNNLTIIVAASDSSAASRSMAQYVCDGISDGVEIQHAITSLTSSGGTVSLTEGTFTLGGSITVQSPRTHVVLEGQGEERTTLNFVSVGAITTYAPYTTFKDFKVTGSGQVRITNGGDHIKVQNITMTTDAKQDGAFSVLPVMTTIEDIEFSHCKAINCGSIGFINGGWNSPIKIKNIRYYNCQAINCGKYSRFNNWVVGFDFAETPDIEGCLVQDCYAEGNWESGFHVETVPRITDMRFVNCVSKNNAQKTALTGEDCHWGAGFVASYDTTLENCRSENNKNGYIFYNGGCTAINCSDTDSWYTGYTIGGTANGARTVEIRDCKSIGSSYRIAPIFLWPPAIPSTIDGMTILSNNNEYYQSAILIRDDYPHPGLIAITNTLIEGYHVGVNNSASHGLVEVSNVSVLNAEVDYINCTVSLPDQQPLIETIPQDIPL